MGDSIASHPLRAKRGVLPQISIASVKPYAETTNRLMIRPMLTNHTNERTGAQSAK